MANRKKIAIGEYYHIYNRGSDKRSITKNNNDAERFIQSLKFFNSKKPIESLRKIISDKNIKSNNLLVEIICYDLNLNHYHLLLKEINDGGISEFMKRVSGGYTWYFNNKYKRSGVLFQGRFKSVHIKSNEQLLHTSVYVNLNWRVHKINISGSTADATDISKRIKSSWNEYIGKTKQNICIKEIILGQFESVKDYKDFALSSLKEILKSKEDKNNLEMLIGKHFF